MSNLTISMRFAVDRDNNRQISKEEVVGFADLAPLDTVSDKVLKGRELEPVYYEYGKDVWLQAGRTNRLQSDAGTSYVTLNSIGLEPPKIDLNVNLTYRAR
jgi:hypothetical protein